MALPEKKAYDQYKETQITTANQGKLIVMLYDGAIKFLNIATENMQPKTYDIVNNNILKTQDILSELILSLNMKEGGEISNNLLSLYMYFKKKLLEANINKDPKILKDVIVHLKELRDAWEKISANEAKSDKNIVENKGSFSIEG
ncbi:flagellar export chaperone FliS [Spirochaetota bacterium]